jgi:hypothetical protein
VANILQNKNKNVSLNVQFVLLDRRHFYCKFELAIRPPSAIVVGRQDRTRSGTVFFQDKRPSSPHPALALLYLVF